MGVSVKLNFKGNLKWLQQPILEVVPPSLTRPMRINLSLAYNFGDVKPSLNNWERT
jgi:hypothetical protein